MGFGDYPVVTGPLGNISSQHLMWYNRGGSAVQSYGSGNPLCIYGTNGTGANNANGSWGNQRASLTPANLYAKMSSAPIQIRLIIKY